MKQKHTEVKQLKSDIKRVERERVKAGKRPFFVKESMSFRDVDGCACAAFLFCICFVDVCVALFIFCCLCVS